MRRCYLTCSDHTYLVKGLLLYHSLLHHSSDEFELLYLCLDLETYNKLISLDLKSLYPVYADFVPCLRKEETFNEVGLSRIYYCRYAAIMYTQYLVEACNKSVLYVDADTFFTSDPVRIFQEARDYDVALVPHVNPDVFWKGTYNRGTSLFRYSKIGRKAAALYAKYVGDVRSYRKRVDNGTHSKPIEYATQDYLDIIEGIYHGVGVLDKTVAFVGPWNFEMFGYDNFSFSDPKVTVGGKTQTMVLYHFSGFNVTGDSTTFSPSSQKYDDEKLLAHPIVGILYKGYFEKYRELEDILSRKP